MKTILRSAALDRWINKQPIVLYSGDSPKGYSARKVVATTEDPTPTQFDEMVMSYTKMFSKPRFANPD